MKNEEGGWGGVGEAQKCLSCFIMKDLTRKSRQHVWGWSQPEKGFNVFDQTVVKVVDNPRTFFFLLKLSWQFMYYKVPV